MRTFAPDLPRGLILDLGCGPATNAELLAPISTGAIAFDRSQAALHRCQARGYGTPVAGDALALPFADRSFGLVAALDILEHLIEDATALAEIRRVLVPGGLALILVPAFQSLWGWQDEVSGHLRRYTPGDIRAHSQRAGLTILKLTCINSALALPVLLARRLLRFSGLRARSENTLTPAWLNSILYSVFVAEAPIAQRVDLPYGTSVACLARRTG